MFEHAVALDVEGQALRARTHQGFLRRRACVSTDSKRGRPGIRLWLGFHLDGAVCFSVCTHPLSDVQPHTAVVET